MTVGEALHLGADRLQAAGSETPRLDAELLLGHATRLSRTELYAEMSRPLAPADAALLEQLLARRERREPVAYILGEWGFRRLTLRTDERALIPRPETEVVVERCLARLEGREAPTVLDVGTGSGAIAFAIADEHPGARVTGIDTSADALELAGENARRTGLTIVLERADILAGFPAGPWDLVVSNPPYVDPDELIDLMPDVRDWEPHVALVGRGATEAVIAGAADTLNPGGALVLEVGDGQADHVAAQFERAGYANVRTTADLAGRDRVVEGTR
jgi:release factor glutamine methyltransferase